MKKLHSYVTLLADLILVPITIAIAVALIADLDSPTRALIRLDQRAMQRLKPTSAANTQIKYV